MQITYTDVHEASRAAKWDEFPDIISLQYDRDEYGNITATRQVWALFKHKKLNQLNRYFAKVRDTESSGPYRGTYSDEVVGF